MFQLSYYDDDHVYNYCNFYHSYYCYDHCYSCCIRPLRTDLPRHYKASGHPCSLAGTRGWNWESLGSQTVYVCVCVYIYINIDTDIDIDIEIDIYIYIDM